MKLLKQEKRYNLIVLGLISLRRISHLDRLESESIYIFRECLSQAERPVILFSAGKDSTVLAYLAVKAFYPAKPPAPLLHIDSTWEFSELLKFRDDFANHYGFDLKVFSNQDGKKSGINPFDHGDRYTLVMRTEPLKTALNMGNYDFIFGGARRDEERSRAKERIISIRNEYHGWDPKDQRPEFHNLYNLQLSKGQSARVFPLSNWTEQDILDYALREKIKLAPLYFTKEHEVVTRGNAFIAIDDMSLMRLQPDDNIIKKNVRFRTLGCWPVTGAIESNASNLQEIIDETLNSRFSERQGRLGDSEDGGSLEQKKKEGYF